MKYHTQIIYTIKITYFLLDRQATNTFTTNSRTVATENSQQINHESTIFFRGLINLLMYRNVMLSNMLGNA